MKSSDSYLYKNEFISKILHRVASGDYSQYKSGDFGTTDSDIIRISDVKYSINFALENPQSGDDMDIENCITLFENMKDLSPSEASDGRLWTYLVHERHINYSMKRWPIDFNSSPDRLMKQVLLHFVLHKNSVRPYLDNALARLWWIAYLTYAKDAEDPYELTKELLSDSDYTRTLLTSLPGRNKVFLHAFLRYAIDSDWLKTGKEAKVRSIMKRINFISSYRNFGLMSEDEIIDFLQQEEERIMQVV